MKSDRLIAAAFFTAIAVSPVLAQTRPASPAPAPVQPAATNASVPDTKVALINTEAFADEKQGIVRVVAAIKRVETEFQPRRTELQTLQQKVQQLADEIEKTKNVADPKTLQQKVEQAEQMKKDFQRKQEDAQAAYNKRMQEVMGPIYDDIGKSLDAFGKARGISLLLDASKIGPAILTAAEAIDVTRAFIADFNTKYPATALATSPQ